MTQQWEYLRTPILPGNGGPNLAALDGFGREGWELVCYVPDDHREPDSGLVRRGGYLLFKRPKGA